ESGIFKNVPQTASCLFDAGRSRSLGLSRCFGFQFLIGIDQSGVVPIPRIPRCRSQRTLRRMFVGKTQSEMLIDYVMQAYVEIDGILRSCAFVVVMVIINAKIRVDPRS